MKIENNTLITFTEFMKRLNIRKTKAYELIRSGKIKAGKEGNRWKVSEESLNQYIQEILKSRNN